MHQRLLQASGLPVGALVPADGAREQELSEICLLLAAEQGFVACHHVRFSSWTLEMMQRFQLKTVVLVRDLLDVIVSTHDHLEKEGFGGGNPMLFLNEKTFFKKSKEERMDMLVDLLVPWHIQFFLSWAHAPPSTFFWVQYEEFYQNPEENLKKLMEKLGIPFQEKGNFSRAGTRFNIGRAGRGREQLTQKQIARIQAMLAYYPEVDFSLIGGHQIEHSHDS